MFAVVGLGNPGLQYAGTRHNIGFEVIDCLSHRFSFPAYRSWKKSEVTHGIIGRHRVVLAKPMTYMNLSGDAVSALLQFHKIQPEQLIVVHDELDFEPGVVRMKAGGGPGGHNGLRSIITHAGREFVRVRVGVGKPPPRVDGASWVLSKFDSTARRAADDSVQIAADAIEVAIVEGVDGAMNRFNRRESAS